MFTCVFRFVLVLCCSGAAVALRAQSTASVQALKSADVERHLKQIASLETAVDDFRFGKYASVIKELKLIAASSDRCMNIWLDSVKQEEFEERGKTTAEFMEWKRKTLKEPNHARDEGLQLQVQWLIIVLMNDCASKPERKEEVLKMTNVYMESLIGYLKKHDGRQEYISGGVTGSPIARKLKVNDVLPKLKPGEERKGIPASGGNLGAIYEGVVFPYYREAKNWSGLMDAWERRIAQEGVIADAADFVEAKQKFADEQKPRLVWQRHIELFDCGQEVAGIAAMEGHIKAQIRHADAAAWVGELKQKLEGRKEALLQAPVSVASETPVPTGAAVPGPATGAETKPAAAGDASNPFE